MIPIQLDDDKSDGKCKGKPACLFKYKQAQQLLNAKGPIWIDQLCGCIFSNPFFAYLCFLAVCLVVSCCLDSGGPDLLTTDWVIFASQTAEGLGLLSLLVKVKWQKSVMGVSGMTIIMYAFVYVLRGLVMIPDDPWCSRRSRCMHGWMVEIVDLVALLMVIDAMRSIFWTYRASYQRDLDVLNVKYLIPGCLLLAGVLHPHIREGRVYTYLWTAELYLDVLALLPQVVMMARGEGTVEAPIAHFVAATALSRMTDLSLWLFSYYSRVGLYSCVLVVFFQTVNLLLIADFLYYYLKARILKPLSLMEETRIPMDNLI